ncbi:MAG: putative transport system permease protein [Actinomycetota bacterium]|nr:putative transport system permease protein [Actinomycetota bacterium]
MPAIAVVARSRLRGRRGVSALLVLLVAIGVGVTLAGFAGARRTDAALPTFVRYSKGADAYATFVPKWFGGNATRNLGREVAAARAVPEVLDARRFTNGVVSAAEPGSTAPPRRILAWVGIDRDYLRMIGRPLVVHGRVPNDRAINEVAIDENLARDARLHVGSRYRLRVFTVQQASAIAETVAQPQGFATTAMVVGILRYPTDVRDLQGSSNAENIYQGHYDLYLTPAFWRAAHGDIAGYNPAIAVTLRRGGRDLGAFRAAMARAFPNNVEVASRSEFLMGNGTLQGVDRSMSLQSRAFQAFAVVSGLAALFLVGQVLGRQVLVEGADDPTLRSIGMTRPDLVVVALLRAAVVTALGCALGVLVALGLSPLTPLPHTTARRAELHLGLHPDWTVLVFGAGIAAGLMTAVALLPTLRRGVDATARGGPTVASRFAARSPSPAAAIGLRFALEPGRGARAVPVRSALVASTLAVTTVLGAATFATSFHELRRHPARYGVTWDIAAGGAASAGEARATEHRLARIAGIQAYAGIGTTVADVDGHQFTALVMQRERGLVSPQVVEGRAPAGPNEVALGGATMDRLGLGIGDTARFAIPDFSDGRFDFEVVGRAVLNASGIDNQITPGDGALFDWSAVTRVGGAGARSVGPQSFLIRFAPTADPGAVRRAVRRAFPSSTTEAIEPPDVVNLGDVTLLPLALGGIVTLLGIATITHALVSAARRRRNELAVTKALGFVGRQTEAVVLCQALTLSLLALAIGIPAGIAVGRTAWAAAASQLHVVDRFAVPALPAAMGACAFVAVVAVIALVPAVRARRLSTAEVLRSE